MHLNLVVRNKKIIGWYNPTEFAKLPFDDWPDFSNEYLKHWVKSLLIYNSNLRYEISKMKFENKKKSN